MTKFSENFNCRGWAVFIKTRTSFFLFLMFQVYHSVVVNFKNMFSDCKKIFIKSNCVIYFYLVLETLSGRD
jgi:hypothetical protein